MTFRDESETVNSLNPLNWHLLQYCTTYPYHLHSFWTTELSATTPDLLTFEWEANREQFYREFLTWLSSFSRSLLGYGMFIIFLKYFYYNHYIGTAHKIALTSHKDRNPSKYVWFILNMWFQTADTEYIQAITEFIENNTSDPRPSDRESR